MLELLLTMFWFIIFFIGVVSIIANDAIGAKARLRITTWKELALGIELGRAPLKFFKR